MSPPRAARVALAALVLLAAVALGAYLVLLRKGNRLLQDAGEAWIDHRIATLSDSVYRVQLHRLRFQQATRSLYFDSLTLRTDVVRNQARFYPIATLTLSVHNGRVKGIDLWRLVTGRRIHASEVGFDSVNAVIVLPPIFRDSAPADAADDSSSSAELVVVADTGAFAPGDPIAIVDRVRFGNMSGRLVLPFQSGPQALELGGLSVDLDHVAFDPRRRATTPFRVSDVRVEASRFEGDLGRTDRLAFVGLAGSFRDSTLRADSIRLAPRDGDAGFLKGRKYRGTRVQMGADHLTVEGLDYSGLIRGTHLAVRRVVADGFELDLLLDKRLPANPGPQKRLPSPQERVAALRGLIAIDSVVLHRSRVQYAERVSQADRPGRLRFEEIEGAITNLSNDALRQSDSTPLRLDARARFMGAGALEARIEFPLLAPGFEARYRARLGRMDAVRLNEILGPLTSAEVKEGEFTALRLDARVHNGVYAGTLIPEFRNLGVRFVPSAKERKKEHGIGGMFKDIKRAVMGVAANTVVRTNNPAKPGKPPATGKVTFVRRPFDSFWAGIWQSLKPALKESLMNVDL